MTISFTAWLPVAVLTLTATALLWTFARVSRRIAEGDVYGISMPPLVGRATQLSLMCLLGTASGLVIAPALDDETAGWLWPGTLQTLTFALLFPFLFYSIRQFTQFNIPHWRSLRAFIFGSSLITALQYLSAEFTGIGEPLTLGPIPAYVVVGYVLALFSSALATYRLVSTPRQHRVLSLIGGIPLLLIGTDYLTRAQGASWLGQPLLSWAILASALSLSLLRTRQLSVRPVARSALVDHVQDALLVVDSKNYIVDFNQALADWLGTTKLCGQRCDDLLPATLISGLSASGPLSAVLPWPKNDEEHWYEAQLTPIQMDGARCGTLVTLRDITRRHLAEAALRSSRKELETANEQLARLARTDPLTGLENRRSLMQRLELEANRHTRSGLALGVIAIDLDHFKSINDQHGHPVGDRVLEACAATLTKTCRDADVTARIGGEEFVVVAVDSGDQGPVHLAERLREAVAAMRVSIDSIVELRVTASFGVVVHRGGTVDPETLLRLADDALYKAKAAGRNRVVVNQYVMPGDTRRAIE